MAHMLVRYAGAGAPSWGRVDGPAPSGAKDTVPVQPLEAHPKTLRELINLPRERLKFGGTIKLPASSLLSPVTTDARLVCQGLNYQEHAAEAQQATRRSNLVFAKASSALSAPFGPIVRPPDVQLLDYEVEIGLVLRTTLTSGAEVTADNIGSYIAGVVLCNDVRSEERRVGKECRSR